MDTIQHVAHGFLIGVMTNKLIFSLFAISTPSIPLLILCGILWALNISFSFFPDFYGWLGLKKGEEKWKVYEKYHELSFKNPLVYVPGGFLHILLDKYCHGPNNRWWVWNEKLYFEILGIAITILLFCILI